MKNKVMPQNEVTALENLFKSFDELKKQHNEVKLTPEMLKEATDLEQLHIAVYLDLLHELASTLGAIKDLITMPEEDFVRIITKEGTQTIDEVKANIMMKMFLDIIEGN